MFLVISSLFSIKQLVLPVILGATCLLGDIIVDIVKKYDLLRSLCDNLTHATIGALSALILVVKFHDRLPPDEQKLLVIFGFVAAALVDVDHFIEARSFRLKDATNLSSRPFLHCSNIPFIILLVFLVSVHLRSFRLNLWLAVLFTAIMTHHTRDATRRGFWIQPYGHTEHIPYVLYVGLTVIIPYAMVALMNAFRHKWDENIHMRSVYHV